MNIIIDYLSGSSRTYACTGFDINRPVRKTYLGNEPVGLYFLPTLELRIYNYKGQKCTFVQMDSIKHMEIIYD